MITGFEAADEVSRRRWRRFGRGFPTEESFRRAVRMELRNCTGVDPVRAVYDGAGNCVICGEAGRCPGWHHPDEARVRRNPDEMEFLPVDTGGNCTALYAEHGGFHILVTDYDDPIVPIEGRRFIVGLYDATDEYLFSREFRNFDLFALEGNVLEAIRAYRSGDQGRSLEDMR